MADPAIPISDIGGTDPELVPTLTPYLVQVIIPFSTGTVDEAVRQVQAIVGVAVEAAVDEALAPVNEALSHKLTDTANLSDVSNAAQARDNLGVTTAIAASAADALAKARRTAFSLSLILS